VLKAEVRAAAAAEGALEASAPARRSLSDSV